MSSRWWRSGCDVHYSKCVQVFGPSHTVCVRVPSFSGTAVACFPTWLVVGGTAVAAWMEGVVSDTSAGTSRAEYPLHLI